MFSGNHCAAFDWSGAKRGDSRNETAAAGGPSRIEPRRQLLGVPWVLAEARIVTSGF